MTIKNKKATAIAVDILPHGRVITKEGDYVLVATSTDMSTWYLLNPPPVNIEVGEEIPRNATILRQVGENFQIKIADAVTWLKVVAPIDMAKNKTYFQVMKVAHTPLIVNPKAVYIQYRRDGTHEWVRNIQVAERPAPKHKTERERQIAAGREMALA